MTRVLVVDDEPLNCALLEAMLAPEGYFVTCADGGEDALRAMREAPSDLVLLDLSMPGMDGVETCRRIREAPGGELIPVVIVTAHGERDARIRAKAAGVDDFLEKPIDETELLVRVRNLLRVKALHDLRARRQEALTQELAERSEQLLRAERLATLGTLASAVGHELGNLDAALDLAVSSIEHDLARERRPDPEDLATLRRVARAVRAHAGQLLSLGRPGPERVEVFDLGDLAGEVSATLASIGRTRGIEVRVELPPEGIAVVASRTRIEQVVLNLLLNATDALAAVPPERRRVTLRATLREGRAWCEVDDTGPGIPDDLRMRVFEPWFTTKPVGRGTGLGLLVVRHIIEGYGGTISVGGRPGEGAVMRFDLPAV